MSRSPDAEIALTERTCAMKLARRLGIARRKVREQAQIIDSMMKEHEILLHDLYVARANFDLLTKQTHEMWQAQWKAQETPR